MRELSSVRREQEPLNTTRRGEIGSNKVNGENRENRENTGGYRRQVRVQQEQVSTTTWAERNRRGAPYRRPRDEPSPVKNRSHRSFEQTGSQAPEERVQLPPRKLPPMRSSIPARSGQQRRKRGFWQRILGLFAVLALVIGAGSFALLSPNFRVRDVTVTGTGNPVLVQTIQRLGIQGQNIFLLDVSGLTERVDAIPLVESASIQKAWPNQIAVSVVERLPVLLWQTPAATFSVDSHGVVIGAEAAASQTAGIGHLMTVVDMRSKRVTQQVQPGTRLDAANIAFALQIFRQLPQVVNLASFTLTYTASGDPSSGASFNVVSPQGWVAYLGNAGDSNPLANRLLELSQILSKGQQDQLTLATIDLRYGLRPVFTIKNS